MFSLPAALAPLASRTQFVCWIAAPHPSIPSKLTKFPVAYQGGEGYRAGDVINTHDPKHWTDPETAGAMAATFDRGYGAGIGYVFTADDPYFFLDIDGCLTPDGWSRLATDLCGRFPGAAVEISQSGKGLHVIGRSGPLEHACKNTPLGLELYTAGRFVALTGTGAQGSVDTDHTAALAATVAELFPPSVTGDFEGWTAAPVPEWAGPTDDDELISRMLKGGDKSAGGVFGGVTARSLWEADEAALSVKWPGQGRPFDASQADMALANHLAFWTGKDCERIATLMRRSALARPKWDTHRTYLADTVLKACRYVTNVAHKREPPPPVVIPTDAVVQAAAAATTGRRVRDPNSEWMAPFAQLDHFKDCWFLSHPSKVYSLQHNALFSATAFDVIYGGHMFVLDPQGQKNTDSAWTAFTKSRVNVPPIVTDVCFRPELPPGTVVGDGASLWVNSYVPHLCERRAGDVAPFIDHLKRMLPNDHDRAILINYMASLVQNPGRKFQWWPVLQGVKGNGKTLIITALTHIVGEQYTHLPNAMVLAREGMKFNTWLNRKLFVGIEEVRVHGKWDFLEEFKAVITNGRIGMEPKGGEQETRDNRANGILCTNHKDGVPITDDERRYCVLFSAQQTKADLARDGMTGDYFPRLYDWFRREGAAYVADWLLTCPIIAALDPAAAAHRAPDTSSTAEAIQVSQGRLEQEIQEAIEEGRPGFAGGWISSKYLDELVDRLRIPAPRQRRRMVLQVMGYDWHPALKDGRVNDMVMPDGMKPRLYLRNGHAALHLQTSPEIAAAYSAAQAPGANEKALLVVARSA